MYSKTTLNQSLPSLPPQGYGKRIMFGIEAWVVARGLPPKISATVDAAQTRLIAFYESLGAVTEQNSAPHACFWKLRLETRSRACFTMNDWLQSQMQWMAGGASFLHWHLQQEW